MPAHACAVKFPLIVCQVTSRPSNWLSRYSKTDGTFQDRLYILGDIFHADDDDSLEKQQFFIKRQEKHVPNLLLTNACTEQTY